MNLSFCRDDLHGRLLVLNTFQKSIRLILLQTSIQTTVETTYMGVFKAFKRLPKSLRLVIIKTLILRIVETCYTRVSMFNRSKTFYEFIFL